MSNMQSIAEECNAEKEKKKELKKQYENRGRLSGEERTRTSH
jgi:hypothetical protein